MLAAATDRAHHRRHPRHPHHHRSPPTRRDNLAAALAAAADAATAEHLLLMQTPAIGLTHDWLTRLIGYSNQPDIAAAGPIVLAPDGRIQQAGIAIPERHPPPPACTASDPRWTTSSATGPRSTT